ncbi:protoporphyrinogen oxidase [Cellulomonas carbonis]|uniref:protoporphyrinogen oxidase n=2 Tax=Cellulomonas carbonis TaxID=1386092 RepID=UPI001662B328|nr:protoporphyrinogen oxidase [Cellulomonas carbonis]GGC00576.1 protoporphyrinogen oxidase [Cellulomonas carbonis]
MSAGRVVVVGAGVAGLVAARDLAAGGRDVTVLEASPGAGGCVAPLTVDGLRVDAGAESFATRSPAVTDLLTELGLADDVVLPVASGAWLQTHRGAVPLPRAGMLGIPGSPWAADVRAVVGVAGALRASADRLLPARVGHDAGSLGRLVRVRQGRRVLDRLVTPVVAGVHAAHPDEADLDAVLPGVRDRLARHGSLGAAVAAMRAAAPAGSAVAGLRGGMHRLVAALVEDLTRRGVDVRSGTAVTRVERSGAAWRLVTADGSPLAADDVVVAVPGPVALGLLADVVPAAATLDRPADTGVVLVTMALDAPALDAAPRGTGLLVAPGAPGVRAKALTHATAKWPWLAEAAGPGRHVVRLSYGGPGHARVPADDELFDAALADAAHLLGVPLRPGQVLDRVRTPWPAGLPQVRPGHRERVSAVRDALERERGLHAVGAWLAGTGLVSVVADARAVAARLAA